MIKFDHVSRAYGDKLAVDSLDLRIGDGELFALLGHNGAGKTTTIKMIVGLLMPGSGTLHVGGHDVVNDTRSATSLIGYVPDQPYLYDKLSGREMLQFVAQMYGIDADRTRNVIDFEIERFELGSFVDDLTESYSHGMKQRTVFALAMLHAPRVLVVDEPLIGLDPHSIRLVKDLLKQEAENGTCVFMSTHSLAAVEEIAGRIAIMSRGRLQYDGSISHLREQHSAAGQSLESIYLSITDSIGTPES